MKVELSDFHTLDLNMLVKLKGKGQLTIPADVRSQISAEIGDMFEVAVADGNIVLKPLDLVSRNSKQRAKTGKGPDISKWIGAGKGLFKSPKEADAFIQNERKKWD